jgi:hypothetical protein
VQKQLKRKRASNGPAIATAEKEALVAGCRQELQGMFEYYKEVSGHRMQLEGGNLSSNAMIGCLLEESNLGLTKLVDEAFENLKETEGVSVALVRSSVLLIGQRMMYGQSSPDADVLEDESELSLWCWEVNPTMLQAGVVIIQFTYVFLKLKLCIDALWLLTWLLLIVAGERSEVNACENSWFLKWAKSCQKEDP